MNTQDEALAKLNNYLASQGLDVSSSQLGAWDITSHKDAYIFNPKGVRSNSLYLVRGSSVNRFSPATTSIDEAYDQVSQDHNN